MNKIELILFGEVLAHTFQSKIFTWSCSGEAGYRFVPEKEWNSEYIHAVLDKLLEHSLLTLGNTHIEL